jgi:hypothetical protein
MGHAKRTMQVLLAANVLASLVSLFVFSCYFQHNRPERPQPEKNLIYPLNEHGWVVYLSRGESVLMEGLFDNGLCSMIVLFVWRGLPGIVQRTKGRLGRKWGHH